MKRFFTCLLLVTLLLVVIQAQALDALELGGSAEGEITDDATEVTYTLTAAEGDIVLIEMRRAADSDLFSTALIVEEPGGDEIINTLQGSSNDVTVAAFVAESAGDYTVTATRGEFSSSTGEYVIRAMNLEMLEAGNTVRGNVNNETLDQYYALPADSEVSLSYVQTDGQYFLSFRIMYAIPNFGTALIASAGAIQDISWTVSLETSDDYPTIVSIGADSLDFEFNEIDSNFELTLSE
jgi:hypothetical protein